MHIIHILHTHTHIYIYTYAMYICIHHIPSSCLSKRPSHGPPSDSIASLMGQDMNAIPSARSGWSHWTTWHRRGPEDRRDPPWIFCHDLVGGWWSMDNLMIIYGESMDMVGGWTLPLWKRLEFVNWDDELPNWMEQWIKVMFQSPPTSYVIIM